MMLIIGASWLNVTSVMAEETEQPASEQPATEQEAADQTAAPAVEEAITEPEPAANEAPAEGTPATEEKPLENESAEQSVTSEETAKEESAAEAPSANEGMMGLTRHVALTLTSTPKYTAETKHFDYVNPDAPKGGMMRLPSIGSFDSLNPFTIKGSPASGIGLIYDQLMENSLDEGSTQYCHLCEWVSYPEDYSSVTFKLREGATFHDGTPIKVEDVIFSMEELKNANPRYGQYYKNVTRAEKTGDAEVTFYFDQKGNRELPFIVGEIYVLPKHYWTGVDEKGEQRSLSKTTLEIPLGSGAYKIKEVRAGQSIVYERVPAYWGKDLFTKVGLNNFDEVRFEYFRDSSVGFEAFKAGAFDFYLESSSVNWARGYDFNALSDGRVIKRDDYVLKNPQGMQSFTFNTRLSKFSDIKVREALSRAFNFEWAAKNLFFNQYKRTTSFFENSELASSGKPSADELALLEPLKADLPAGVLTEEYEPFVHAGNKGTRKQLREARRLLEEAGWTIRAETVDDKSCGYFCRFKIAVGLQSQKKTHVLRNKAGEPLKIEFLIVAPAFQRVIQGYVKNLEQLGVRASIRLVDSPQYQKRLETYDYDVIIASFGQSESPGNEQRFYWGSQSADQPGNRNYAGIKSKAVDALIDKIIFAKDREALVTATHALDRVLLFSHYVVPNWHVAYERFAYWDRFGIPETRPSRSIGNLETWWFDAKKDAVISEGGSKRNEPAKE